MPRKRPFGYDAGNSTPDGDYLVGKGRPPEHGKFRKGDGRKRGRRPKGTRNLATDLREELDSQVTVTVAGVPKKVSRQRAIIMRMADNATKGQPGATALMLELQQRLVDPLQKAELAEAKMRFDFSDWPRSELDVFTYLSHKGFGGEEPHNNVVGVIPIYSDGSYMDRERRETIAEGLAAYGIEIDDSMHFPPKCRLRPEDGG